MADFALRPHNSTIFTEGRARLMTLTTVTASNSRSNTRAVQPQTEANDEFFQSPAGGALAPARYCRWK
jgi:hypothetical protein